MISTGGSRSWVPLFVKRMSLSWLCETVGNRTATLLMPFQNTAFHLHALYRNLPRDPVCNPHPRRYPGSSCCAASLPSVQEGVDEGGDDTTGARMASKRDVFAGMQAGDFARIDLMLASGI